MKIQFYCDDTLISTFDGTREEIGAMMKEAARQLGLGIDDDFELQNRLTVLFNEKVHSNMIYHTGRFSFRLHAPENVGRAA